MYLFLATNLASGGVKNVLLAVNGTSGTKVLNTVVQSGKRNGTVFCGFT